MGATASLILMYCCKRATLYMSCREQQPYPVAAWLALTTTAAELVNLKERTNTHTKHTHHAIASDHKDRSILQAAGTPHRTAHRACQQCLGMNNGSGNSSCCSKVQTLPSMLWLPLQSSSDHWDRRAKIRLVLGSAAIQLAHERTAHVLPCLRVNLLAFPACTATKQQPAVNQHTRRE